MNQRAQNLKTIFLTFILMVLVLLAFALLPGLKQEGFEYQGQLMSALRLFFGLLAVCVTLVVAPLLVTAFPGVFGVAAGGAVFAVFCFFYTYLTSTTPPQQTRLSEIIDVDRAGVLSAPMVQVTPSSQY
jgi:glucan phosphoethanolaminetransferase (alkaline phosphatase superfamily)